MKTRYQLEKEIENLKKENCKMNKNKEEKMDIFEKLCWGSIALPIFGGLKT